MILSASQLSAQKKLHGSNQSYTLVKLEFMKRWYDDSHANLTIKTTTVTVMYHLA